MAKVRMFDFGSFKFNDTAYLFSPLTLDLEFEREIKEYAKFAASFKSIGDCRFAITKQFSSFRFEILNTKLVLHFIVKFSGCEW